MNGRLKQSVSRWCYEGIEMDAFCREVKAIGLAGIDLLDIDQCPQVAAHGLVATMINGPGSIEDGWNDPENHAALIARTRELLPKIAEAGMPNMIVFSGNRRGRSDEEGLANCQQGLSQIMPLAEERGVNVVMELLNSKRDHKDYHCDRTAWGAALAQRLGSPRFKLLYDIYHMQIMEGDIIDTFNAYREYIGHIHTGGVPGRHEIDETQELNYRRICEAIAESGFDGYMAHEFLPTRDPITSLRHASQICNV